MVISEIAVNDAGLVLRQLIVSMGGLCAGAAAAFALWHALPWLPKWLPRVRRSWRASQPRKVQELMVAVLLVSYVGVAILTTDHIYRHLLANDAPAWQLWGALSSFALGAVSLVALLLMTRRRDEP